MPSKLKRYDLVTADAEHKLVSEVNQLIEKGWKPIGGPVPFQQSSGKQALVQAMVKIDPRG